MKKETLQSLGFFALLAFTWIFSFWAIPIGIGQTGFFGAWFETHTVLKMAIVWILTAHLTIAAMSIAFHRAHTHQAVKLNKFVDYTMQVFLWGITSMTKPDWVSVHVYHHAQSDTPNDPHSPKHKGLAHVFFMGAYDYTVAKNWPEVLKIRKKIPLTPFEGFIAGHSFLGPLVLTAALMFLLGPVYGSILGVLNFSISPLFAVGGVNALAHSFGYQNYDSKDESRNLGFLLFLNWIISGELDHNNHHRYPKSPTFAHRWFEFDIGWVYVRVMKGLGLARVTGTIPKYSPEARAQQGIAAHRETREPHLESSLESTVAFVS